ncbi:MAG: ligase-associated DNA damage response endonuclease PdeM [Sulfitobacter sp.]
MNMCCQFNFSGLYFTALGSGALWWAERRLLCVSDLHLGKSERVARRGGAILPPYETQDTLERLEQDLQDYPVETVVCLGDSFDDMTAGRSLPTGIRGWVARLQSQREWVWIQGNHDPAPMDMGGVCLPEVCIGPITFRHIAVAGASGEVSGHYHPKASLRFGKHTISRPAFLIDGNRVIMPAYGTYTGGLRSSSPVLQSLMSADACAILTGFCPTPIPMPR